MRPSLWQPLPDEVKQLQSFVRRLDALKDIAPQESNCLETVSAQVAALIAEYLDYLQGDIKRTERLIKRPY